MELLYSYVDTKNMLALSGKRWHKAWESIIYFYYDDTMLCVLERDDSDWFHVILKFVPNTNTFELIFYSILAVRVIKRLYLVFDPANQKSRDYA